MNRKSTTTSRKPAPASRGTPTRSKPERDARSRQASAAGKARNTASRATSASLPQNIEAQGQLLASDGKLVTRVQAYLSVHAQGWAGRLKLAANRLAARKAARYLLRLDTGGGGRLTVKFRDGANYLVEGAGPFELAVEAPSR